MCSFSRRVILVFCGMVDFNKILENLDLKIRKGLEIVDLIEVNHTSEDQGNPFGNTLRQSLNRTIMESYQITHHYETSL